MDLSNQPELQAIFRAEIEERSRRLGEGAQAMAAGELDAGTVAELARDAHTIKGSARVMGFQEIGRGCEALEKAWKAVSDGAVSASEELGVLLGHVTEELEPAVDGEPAGEVDRLRAATDELLRFLGWNPGPDRPRSATGSGAAELPLPPNQSAGDDPAARSPEARAAPHQPQELGGLLSSLESGLVGTATRVDSGKLYRLINRAVEVHLDTEALAEAVRQVRSAPPEDLVDRLAALEEIIRLVDTDVHGLREQALELAAVPLREATAAFPQLVRYLSRRSGKAVRFEQIGDEVEVDRQIVDALREPLRHLIVNAIDHGVESPEERRAAGKPSTATVTLRAAIVEHRLQVSVDDDGRGIDWAVVRDVGERRGLLPPGSTVPHSELSRLLFMGSFSAAGNATDMSGDGNGLAIVGEAVEAINGGLRLESRPGLGTSVILTLPASLALQNVLLVRCEGKQWGIPETAVMAHLPVAAADIRPGVDRMELWHQGEAIPVASFASAVGLPEFDPVTEIVVLAGRVGAMALTVPEVVGRRQVAVKVLGPLLAGAPHLTGAALLGGGEVVVVVEPNRLGERVRHVPSPVAGRPRVLVVDDSRGVRQLVASALASQGFEVTVAGDADEAHRELSTGRFDALIVDYQMPGPDGVDLIRTVRETSRTLPIIMVSGVAKAEDQARAWAAGVDAYLDKSDLRQGALAATLRALLETRGVLQPHGEGARQ